MRDERDEHEEARRLLTPLVGEPAAPSSVDIRRAIADGRRHLRTRRWAGVGAVAAVTALLAAGVPAALSAVRAPEGPPVASTGTPAATSSRPLTYPVPTTPPEPEPEPPAQCELEPPPVPSDALESFAFGTDPTGRIVYGKYFEEVGPDLLRSQPVLWIDGEAVPLDVPGVDPDISAVNSGGVAVGSSFVGEGEEDQRQVAWIYRDGEVTELAGENAEPFAINGDGVVVGTVHDRTVPVVWRSPAAEPEHLENPPGRDPWILSEVTRDGTVVGFRNSDREQPFVWWPDGSVQQVPRPELDGAVVGFRAHALNGHLLVGEIWRTATAAYDMTTGEYTILAQDPPIEIWSMNRHGWVGGEADGYAGLWTPEGGLLTLPDLGFHSEWRSNLPHWVADDGRTIAGEVEVAEGYGRAAVWRCR